MGPNDPFAAATASRPGMAAPPPAARSEDEGLAPTRSGPRVDTNTVAWRGFGIGVGLGLLGLLTSPLAAIGVAMAGLVGALLALVLASMARELPRLRRLAANMLTDAPD